MQEELDLDHLWQHNDSKLMTDLIPPPALLALLLHRLKYSNISLLPRYHVLRRIFLFSMSLKCVSCLASVQKSIIKLFLPLLTLPVLFLLSLGIMLLHHMIGGKVSVCHE